MPLRCPAGLCALRAAAALTCLLLRCTAVAAAGGSAAAPGTAPAPPAAAGAASSSLTPDPSNPFGVAGAYVAGGWDGRFAGPTKPLAPVPQLRRKDTDFPQGAAAQQPPPAQQQQPAQQQAPAQAAVSQVPQKTIEKLDTFAGCKHGFPVWPHAVCVLGT